MYKRIIAATLVFGMAATAPPQSAHAQSNCSTRDKIVERLKSQYQESVRGIGLAGPKAALEIWISSKTRSWTIILTQPNQMSCIVAAGHDWIEIPSPPAADGETALIN